MEENEVLEQYAENALRSLLWIKSCDMHPVYDRHRSALYSSLSDSYTRETHGSARKALDAFIGTYWDNKHPAKRGEMGGVEHV